MKDVKIKFETIFDAGSKNENNMTFYTEGKMEKKKESYLYTYDETKILDSKTPIIGHLEIGCDYVLRTVTGDDNYVMNFREGSVERSVYNTPEGMFATEITTKNIENNIIDGIGNIELEYYISFGESEFVKNIVNIRVDELKND